MIKDFEHIQNRLQKSVSFTHMPLHPQLKNINSQTPRNHKIKNHTSFYSQPSPLLDQYIAKDDHYKKNMQFGPNIPLDKFKSFIIYCRESIIYANKLAQQKRELDPTELEVLNSNSKSTIENQYNEYMDFISKKQISLPEQKDPKKKVLFLDLDQTLICKCEKGEQTDHIIYYKNEKQEDKMVGIKLRPNIFKFLKAMAKHYEMYVFTSYKRHIALSIVKFLDPIKKYIKGTLYRDHCMLTNKKHFLKDLRIIKNKELSQMVILDSKVHSFAFQVENGVPIIDWEGDQKDQELLYIGRYLIDLAYSDDVRVVNKEKFRLAELGHKHIYEIDF